MRINLETTAMLLVDVQERLFPHIDNNTALGLRLEILLKGLGVLEVPIFCNQQYTEKLSVTLPSLFSLLASKEVYEKRAFSCCDNPDILEVLKQSNAKTVILAGIETHVCVLQTVLDLISHGYTPVVVVDAVGSRHQHNHEIALRRMEKEGAILTTSESILFELMRTSTHQQLKAISALVK